MISLSLAFAACFIGSLIQAVCGFGSGPVSMTVLPYLYAYPQAVAITGLFGAAISLTITLTNLKHVNLKLMIPCTISSMIFAALSISLSLKAARVLMMRSLGLILIALAVYNIFLNGRIKIKPTIINGLTAGMISGTLSGLFAMSGPPAAVFMLAATTDNDEYRATLNAMFTVTSVVSISSRAANGTITLPVLRVSLLMLFAVALGLFVGGRIFRKLDGRKLGLAVYGYLILSGFLMLAA